VDDYHLGWVMESKACPELVEGSKVCPEQFDKWLVILSNYSLATSRRVESWKIGGWVEFGESRTTYAKWVNYLG